MTHTDCCSASNYSPQWG